MGDHHAAPMNLATPAGASLLLLVLLATAHSVLGERKLLMPLAPRLHPYGHRVLRGCWHLLSACWLALGLAGLLAPTLAPLLAALFALHGLLALLGSRGRHLSWPLFFLTALLYVL